MAEAAKINVELTWNEMWILLMGIFLYRMINLSYDIARHRISRPILPNSYENAVHSR